MRFVAKCLAKHLEICTAALEMDLSPAFPLSGAPPSLPPALPTLIRPAFQVLAAPALIPLTVPGGLPFVPHFLGWFSVFRYWVCSPVSA